MNTYMVTATFSPEDDLPLMNTVLEAEVAQVQALRAEGRLGAVHASPTRGAVFLEVFADDEDSARATVMTLPMSTWWAIDIYPTVSPPSAS
jgi:muconolactone delta-isomerase